MDTGPEISAPASDGSVIVEGVRLTHPDRVLYPEQGITKLALARYYVRSATGSCRRCGTGR